MDTLSDKDCLTHGEKSSSTIQRQQHFDEGNNYQENVHDRVIFSSSIHSLFSESVLGAMHKLIPKMISRGYFHYDDDCKNNSVTDIYKNMDNGNESDNKATNTTADTEEEEEVKQMKQHEKQWNNRPIYSCNDDMCQIIIMKSSSSSAQSGTVWTKKQLKQELEHYLNNPTDEHNHERKCMIMSSKSAAAGGGRISISEAATKFQVTTKDIEHAVSTSTKLYQIGTSTNDDIIVSESHIHDTLIQVLYTTLPLVGGRMLVSDILSNSFGVPTIHLLHDESSGSSAISFRRVVQDQLNDIIISDKHVGGFRWIMGRKEIVSKEYIHRFQKEVKGVMRGLSIPTSLKNLAYEYNWDPTLLMEQVQFMCDNGTIPGELHGSGIGVGGTNAPTFSSSPSQRDSSSASSSSTTAIAAVAHPTTISAIYTPNIYKSMQRKCVHDFFTTNGYITLAICRRSMGISDGQMEDYVLHLFPEAKCLKSAVINVDMIVSPLEAAVQEAITCKTFVDLKMHIPEALMEDKENICKILHDFVTIPDITSEKSSTRKAKIMGGNVKKDDDGAPSLLLNGVDIIENGEAIYFSQGMVQSICDTILPQLVEKYGKARAEEIDRALMEAAKHKKTVANAVGEDDEPVGGSSKGGKSKRAGGTKKHSSRGRKQNRKTAAAGLSTMRDLSSSAGYTSGVIPLYQVAKRIAEEYPELSDIQNAHGGLVDDTNEECLPSWENDDNATRRDGEDIAYGGDGPLYEFCRRALYTIKFQNACDKAVQVELDKIISVKQGLVSSHKDGATRVRNIEAAFEDPSCFAAACQQVQMFAKSVQALSNSSDSSDIGTYLEHEFLRGCAANFARRVTEYCLFKNDIDSGIFMFDPVEGSSLAERNISDMPSFCLPVDAASRSFNSVYLSCTPDDGGKVRDPLAVLRQEFSGNVGVALARMWILCGGECYFGGKITTEDGNESVRPGNVEGFLCHVKDSCLSMCGLPFKMLDKKGEKQVMFARKKGLKQALEQAIDEKDVLDLSILIIFQQIKHMAIMNSGSTDNILDLLANEKKISSEVINKLRELRDCLKKAQDVPEDLNTAVRLCGLSKDISKHTVQ